MGKIDGTTFTIYTIYIRTRYKYIESRTHRVEDIEELSRRVISISPVPPFPPRFNNRAVHFSFATF